MTQSISGLSEIMSAIDGVVIDQYGVLHDGEMAYDGAVQTLQRLRLHNCPVVALTNSGKGMEQNLARLERLGFTRDLFLGLVSSGEVARAYLESLIAQGDVSSRTKVLLITRRGGEVLLRDLGIDIVKPGENADLILIAGAEPERYVLEEYRKILAPYASGGVPALVVNPDRIMATTAGPRFGPGRLAEIYRNSGGPITILGKPEPHLFTAALDVLGRPDPSRVLMIGDSPEHDIAGAKHAGMKTLLIRSGLQNSTFGPAADFEMPRLNWE